MSQPKAEFDIDELLAALSALKTHFAIYDVERGFHFCSDAAIEHWPVLYERLCAGDDRWTATRAQIESQAPHLPPEEIERLTDQTFGASFSPEPVDFATSNGRALQVAHYPIRENLILAMGVDVTERRAREAELKVAKREAEAASRAKSDFLAKMSHEIRTPMNGVLGIAELLRHTELDETQALYVDTIRRSGQALMTVINDVLDFSKIEAGRMALAECPFRPAAVARDVVDLLSPVASEKGLGLSLHLAPECEREVMGDEGRLRQVVVNIVGNAVKFTEEGEVRIEIEAPEATEEAIDMRIRVVDTGVGVAAEDLGRIFEKFAQASGTDACVGTGLGLSISRSLIEMMGGRISVESEPGRGSCFTIELALPPAEAGARDAASAA
ncbi:MAG: ATP-binding protein [Pseudomonadota bacterium]